VVDGSIAVLSISTVRATNLTIVKVGPASYKLGGKGATNSYYGVYSATNLTPPVTWSQIGTTNSNGSGLIQFVDLQATNAQRFYRFGQ
jgi:hypothetical protein